MITQGLVSVDSGMKFVERKINITPAQAKHAQVLHYSQRRLSGVRGCRPIQHFDQTFSAQ
jgi:hypothetical protein